MLLPSVAPGGRSAFAAAFFSFIFPGLGQAYAGLPRRALAFAALPAVAVILLVAVALSPARSQLLASLASPTVLLAVLVLDLALLFYRALAVVDAYRAAERHPANGTTDPTDPAANDPAKATDSTDPGDPDEADGVDPDEPARAWRLELPRDRRRLASLAGLAAILFVLAGGHMAIARFDLLAYDLITDITSSRPQFGTVGQPSGSVGGSPSPAAASASPSGSARVTSPAESDGPEASASPSPTPSPVPPTPTPVGGTPVAQLPPAWNGAERLNVLLIGTDSDPEGGNPRNYLTDTLIIASVDPDTKGVAMISLPRDTVNVPLPASWPAYNIYGGSVPFKINSLWWRAREEPALFPGDDANRGYIALKGAIGELLGLPIHYFVEVDFDGFKTVVDTLGGVTVDVQLPVSDDRYPTDDGRGAINLYIPAGIQHMDGAQALAYARARTKTNDFDRAARQQRLVRAMRERLDLGSLLLPGRLEALAEALKQAVRTDVPAEMLPRIITLGQEVDLSGTRSLVLAPPKYGVECLECYHITPDIDAIRRAVRLAIAADPAAGASRATLAAENAVVWVADGGAGPTRTASTAAYLVSTGVSAAAAPAGVPAPAEVPTTVSITVYNGAEWRTPETLALLERIFEVTAVRASDVAVDADIVVTLGSQAPALAAP